MGKEKNSLQKFRDLEVQLDDSQFENQKYIQKINELEQQNKSDIKLTQEENITQMREKDRTIKQLKGQRDCMFAEI